MSLNGVEWKCESLEIIGTSLAGVRTCLCLPEYKCTFDVAQGLPFALKANHFFISHAHMDHASGIPYLISLKNLNKHEPPTFYIPEYMVSSIEQILRCWAQIENHKYNYKLVPVSLDSEFPISKSVVVRPFQTTHRVRSFGYTLFKKYKKLDPFLKGLSREDLLLRKQNNLAIEHIWEEPIFTFTGDTQIEFLNSAPWIKQSKVLALECTYYDQQRTIAQTREWGHTHLDEILPLIDKLSAEHILLIHRSLRYSFEEAQRILHARCSDQRVQLFPG